MPLDTNGYTAETLTEIVDSMAATAVSEFGTNIDTTENSVLGILMGLVGIQIEQQGQTIQELYSNMDPDTAEGKSLDNIAYTNGLIRKSGSKSTVSVTFSNTTASVVTVEAQTKVTSSNGSEFYTDTQIFIGASAKGIVKATSKDEGALEAGANTVITYTPNFTGVTVTNPSLASVGTDIESDTRLRQRIYRFLSVGGNSTVNAIASAVSNIAGVTDVLVAENDTWTPRSRGTGNEPRPRKSVEVVVEGGADQDIVDVILATKPAGIQAFGDVLNGLATCVQGSTRVVGFTRAIVMSLLVRVTYTTYCEETFPLNGEELMNDALVAFGLTENTLGRDVINQRYIAAVHTSGVQGIQNVIIETSFDGANYTTQSRILQVFEKANLISTNITFVKQ